MGRVYLGPLENSAPPLGLNQILATCLCIVHKKMTIEIIYTDRTGPDSVEQAGRTGQRQTGPRKAGQGGTEQRQTGTGRAEKGEAGPNRNRQGSTGLGKARQCRTVPGRSGQAEQSPAGLDGDGQDSAKPVSAMQSRVGQRQTAGWGRTGQHQTG